jgi:MFS family permease
LDASIVLPFRWHNTSSAQRRTVLAAGLGWMLDSFDVMLYSIVLATLMREFGMTKGTAGLLNTLTLIASALGGFLFGFFADRLGRRRMMSMCILTYSLFTFACGFSTSVTMLACFRFLARPWHGRSVECRRHAGGGNMAQPLARARAGHCAEQLGHWLCAGGAGG